MLADDRVALVGAGDDAVLHVDHDQGGVRSVLQGGHERSSVSGFRQRSVPTVPGPVMG